MTTDKASDLGLATHILISVPTGVHFNGTIDTRILRSAVDAVLENTRQGTTVVIESSVAVGMTRSLFGQRYLEKGIKVGMSPEVSIPYNQVTTLTIQRVDPGRTNISYDVIPKIISGIDEGSVSSVLDLYSKVFPNLVPVSSLEVAEMTKLYENCQRMVSIAYANEMADACRGFNIDPLEVSKAAATKPFGYQPYNPSIGVGGHCIPVNPYYLLSNGSWPVLEFATQKMKSRPADIGDRIIQTLPAKPRILVVGVSFKKGQSVLSNAPGIDLLKHLLSNHDVYVEFADPLVEQEMIAYCPKMESADWNANHIDQNFDAVVVCIDQDGIDLSVLQSLSTTRVFNFTTSLPWSDVAKVEAKTDLVVSEATLQKAVGKTIKIAVEELMERDSVPAEKDTMSVHEVAVLV